jgi:RNA polymerase sigma factor (TIGR02999 family)
MNTHPPEEAHQSLGKEIEPSSRGEVTRLLLDWNDGNPAARDQLVTIVYGELRRIARRHLRRERAAHTMQTGTLVHEVYTRLFDATGVPCRNRKEFFGIVAWQMRQVLVDAARKRGNQKRGGKQIRIPMEDETVLMPALNLDLIALDEALEELARYDEALSQVVELRFFAEHTIEETAEILGVSPDTVKRRWQRAKLYLHDRLKSVNGDSDGSGEMETD